MDDSKGAVVKAIAHTAVNRTVYTRKQVQDALDRAVNFVAGMEWDGDDEQDGPDAANLVGNLTVAFLDDPESSISAAICESYQDTHFRGWLLNQASL